MPERLSTVSVRGGEDHWKPCGALTVPVVPSSTFVFRDSAEVRDFVREKEGGGSPSRFEYARYGHPTQAAVEHKAAALEGGEAALLFGSGMAALTTTLLAHLRAGDHLVATRGVYRRTADFFRLVLPRYGIEATLAPPDEPAALETAIRPETRLLFTECPSNPYLRVPDLDRLSDIARRHGLPSVVDATFATPVNLRPLEHGFDVVVHSATKYLGGHNDLVAGLAIGRRERLLPVEELRGTLGPCAGARDAGLLLRGLKTLDLRVRRQNETALRVARFLEACPAVERVHYPGLPSHPDHGTACRLMSGFGGVVSFEVRGGLDAASRLVDRLRLPFIGPTLGGVESIVQQPALFVSTDPRKREEAGMADNLVRYAMGIEDADDILADLEQALAVF